MNDFIAHQEGELLTTKEAAAYLRSTENSLRSSRCTGHGPPSHKIGSAVLYKRNELDHYLANLKPYIERRRDNKLAKIDKRRALSTWIESALRNSRWNGMSTTLQEL
ncbi:helix-turn-helix domain-containing protein [Sphingopyxis sp. BSNA05]|uniref:helix-turn-helix domain-containing protein n=1 Tax=Sphingopyxis sp. BSNA05 TaxID=1236614 RepID=UPI00156769D2|nr:helix-turn-helix domain-containing protein [Sphingopyxis sp. BSNA05]